MERDLRELLIDGSRELGIELTDEALGCFSIYFSLLQTWGSRINLTSRLRGREIVVHHFLDSLAGFEFLAASPASRLVDLGSGAGLPAFPLKFALPKLQATLIESVRKKVAFCDQVIRETHITGTTAIWGRGEELRHRPEHHGTYDWVISRALGDSADIVALGLPFLSPQGKMLLYKGAPSDSELLKLKELCSDVGATWHLHSIRVPHLQESRSLIVVRT
jgi:16S rRNA (guanine527-N7)-methyltransferase